MLACRKCVAEAFPGFCCRVKARRPGGIPRWQINATVNRVVVALVEGRLHMNLYTSASEQTDILYIHTQKHTYRNILVFLRRRAAHDSLHCMGLVKHIIQQLLFVQYNLCASNILS